MKKFTSFQQEILPLTPLFLCAMAEGEITMAQRRKIMETAARLGLSQRSSTYVAGVMLEREVFNEDDFRNLHALNEIKIYNDAVIKEQLLVWAAQVCAAASPEEQSGIVLSPLEAAMLHGIARIFKFADLRKLEDRLATECNILLPELSVAEMKQHKVAIKNRRLKDNERYHCCLMQRPFGWYGDIAPVDGIELGLSRNFQERLLHLIAASIWLSPAEKKMIIRKIPDLSLFKQNKLVNILEEEINNFNALDYKYKKQITDKERSFFFQWLLLYREFTGINATGIFAYNLYMNKA